MSIKQSMLLDDYYINSDKIKILIFGHKEFSQLVSTLVPEFRERAQFKIHDAIIGSLTEVQNQIDEFLPDAIISAGANANYLQSNLSIPVIPVKPSESDIAEAISKAASVSKQICVINHGEPSAVVPLLRETLAAEISENLYTTSDQAREFFHINKQIPNIAFVGASLICGMAAQHGLQSFLLYSLKSCRQAIIKSIDEARNHRLSLVDSSLIHWLVKLSKTPIILVNNKDESVTYNQAAKEQIGLELHTLAELNELLHQANISAEDASCTIKGVDWWYHRDQIHVADESMHLFQMYRKKAHIQVQKIASPTHSISHQSDAIKRLLEQVKSYADTPANILIHGESGTGKELIARAIHQASHFRDGQFVALNCSAIPKELFEGELFGHHEGAFTGSKKGGRKGLVESAQNGVLFLDEISELALDQQAKLLRFLQEKTFRPIGSNTETPVVLKLVAASNKDLNEMVKEGQFRQDLYYRLNVLYLKVPALRHRPEDITLISQHKLNALIETYKLSDTSSTILKEIEHPLKRYYWPGNVRELENILERIVASAHLLQTNHKSIENWHDVLQQVAPELFEQPAAERTGLLKQKETELLTETLNRFNGDKRKTAEHLGLSQTTLWRRLKQLNEQ